MERGDLGIAARARGGSFGIASDALGVHARDALLPFNQLSDHGFRLAMIPEPTTGLLVIGGLLGLAGWRSVCA
jgi:hypothetical protein